MKNHAVCHFEWSSTDVERTKGFLTRLFGWECKDWSKEYAIIKTPEGPDGGIMKVDKVEPGRSPFIYIQVEEIEPYLEKAKELGGGVETPKTHIPKVGWYAHVTDHDGNIYGLLQGLKKER